MDLGIVQKTWSQTFFQTLSFTYEECRRVCCKMCLQQVRKIQVRSGAWVEIKYQMYLLTDVSPIDVLINELNWHMLLPLLCEESFSQTFSCCFLTWAHSGMTGKLAFSHSDTWRISGKWFVFRACLKAALVSLCVVSVCEVAKKWHTKMHKLLLIHWINANWSPGDWCQRAVLICKKLVIIYSEFWIRSHGFTLKSNQSVYFPTYFLIPFIDNGFWQT